MGLSQCRSLARKNKTLPCPTFCIFSPGHLPTAIAIETARAVSHNNTKPAIILCYCQARICIRPPLYESPLIPSLGSFIGVLAVTSAHDDLSY
jgi:hypothetical protein